MTATHVKPFFDGIGLAWQLLRNAGVAAPIDSEILYYVLVGAASLPYVNAPEVRLLTGRDPSNPTGSVLTPTGWLPSSCRDY
jgi:aspartate/methionine/tyrosine aminotransferase